MFSPFQISRAAERIQRCSRNGGKVAALFHTTSHSDSSFRAPPRPLPNPIPGPGHRPLAACPAPPGLRISPAANGPIGRRVETAGASQELLTQASLHPLPRPPKGKATAPLSPLPTPPRLRRGNPAAPVITGWR